MPNLNKLPVKSATRFVRAISWIGHPLAFVTVSVGIVVVSRLARRDALSILLVLFVSVILPTALLLFGGVRSGHWSDADISVRTEQKRFYPVAIPLSVIGIVALWSLRASNFVVGGALVTFALFILAAIANF